LRAITTANYPPKGKDHLAPTAPNFARWRHSHASPRYGERHQAGVWSASCVDPGEGMAMHMEGSIEASEVMHPDVLESPQLTFAALNAKIDALPKFPEASTILPLRARWGFAAVIAGALFALLSVRLLPGNATWTLILGSSGVAVEIAGGIVLVLSEMPRKWPTFAGERREFAAELDFDFPEHLKLVDWLRTFPLDQREKLSEFITYRHARMKEKLPMLTGSIEKLGALPIVIALYLQFKDMHWPPHPSWLEVGLIFALVFGYWLSVLQINVRLRIQLYEMLLSKALTQKAR